MIIKGRCRGNGSQLADYLLKSKENDRAQVIDITGTARPDSLKKSLLEMSLTSELTDRTDAGIYHTQLSPRADEAASMTAEQKARMVEILTERLGLEGHKRAVVEHEKEGRIHWHVAFERYDHESGIMWKDDQNYAKHKAASRQMEMEFGWQITHEKKRDLDKDVRDHMGRLWSMHPDPAEFKQTMHAAGFEVTQGDGKRPYEIIDQHGIVRDLTRQLAGVKQTDVAERLNPIRDELRTSDEAGKEYRQTEQSRQQQAEIDRAQKEAARLIRQQQAAELAQQQQAEAKQRQQQTAREALSNAADMMQPPPQPEPAQTYSYGFTVEQPLYVAPTPAPEPAAQPDMSDKAAAMLEQYRQRQAEKQRAKEAKQQAAENQADLTDQAAQMLAEYRRKQEEKQQQKTRDRDGPELI